MTAAPSDVWFDVFPGTRIEDVLSYVNRTWDWLRRTFSHTVTFNHDETALTDNLCEALANRERRAADRMDCDFQSETWELRRDALGNTTRVARTDIRVILGAPGTPHLVIEFKKLDGTAGSRWRYCFDGMNRFVEGKYAVGHPAGVMCGFYDGHQGVEAAAMSAYISTPDVPFRLACIADGAARVVTVPSSICPQWSHFDTSHARAAPSGPIALLHTFLECAAPVVPAPTPGRRRSTSKKRGGRRAKKR